MATNHEEVEAAGRVVRVSNPDKIFWPRDGITKLELVRYYLAVADGAVRGSHHRPTTLYRWPNGVEAPDDAFFQKRVPKHRPEWIATTTIRFPSGRSAEMLVVEDAAHLAWMANLGSIDINPWPVRSGDVDNPDELRLDLDPTEGVPYSDAIDVALTVREVLDEHGLTGYPKTSGKRGIHILARIAPAQGFTEVRKAALALAREVTRRMPEVATTAWWKEERQGVFIDYNQNARDRTVASAYAVRPVPDARVSCPLTWDELPHCDPSTLTLRTVPGRFKEKGDPHEAIDSTSGSLTSLLDLSAEQSAAGEAEAPHPPHHPKAAGEPTRAAPSRRRKKA